MPDSLITAPQTIVTIYPFEGGSYTFSGATNGLLAVQTAKGLSNSVGTFTLQMAPGGPYGLNARPSWTDIITPMSLVVIGMARGAYRQIVMVGIVNSIQEDQSWVTNKGTQRTITIQGVDFQYFFTLPNYYTLSFLGGVGAGAVAGQAELLGNLSNSQVDSSPDIFAAAWYKGIMAGPGSIMANLSFPVGASRVPFYNMVGQYWEPYGGNITIPFAAYYMMADGAWYDKFMEIFPFPWYEFFITTAPSGYYPGTGTQDVAYIPPTTTFNLPGFAPAFPQIIARVNPLPWTPNPSGSTTNPQLQMDQSRWSALPNFTTSENSGISHTVAFSDAEVYNYFIINPTIMTQLLGGSNSVVAPFVFTFAAWADTASIHRYGYRPLISELQWFADPAGVHAQSLTAGGGTFGDFQTLVANLALKQTSYYEPTPNMASGQITTRLRPDILPGTRFTFAPYKDSEQWQFYVEAVDHNYAFGDASTTTLQLSRGLPVSAYANTDLMLALHTGNAQRKNGAYSIGLPPGLGSPLQPVNMNNMQSIVTGIAPAYTTPQNGP